MIFRKAEKKDAAKIAEMLIRIGALHHKGRPDIYKAHLQKYDENGILELLKDENTLIFVAADDADSVVGYAFCQIKRVEESHAFEKREYLYIDDFCVDEELRGQHIGTFLMENIFAKTREMGIEKIELNVWEFNSSAIKFYEKSGFKTQRRQMEFLL